MPTRGGSRGRKKPSLQSLTREPIVGGGQFVQSCVQLFNTDNRTAALVGVALVDQLLVLLLQSKFIPLNDEELGDIFFGKRALLGGLAERITLCHALGLLPTDIKSDLDTMRRIRNVFAHRVQPLSFDNPLIKSECLKLQHITGDLLPLYDDTPRGRYVNCALYAFGALLDIVNASIRSKTGMATPAHIAIAKAMMAAKRDLRR
jgi:hypothetical protein